jgi:hypothetical protein
LNVSRRTIVGIFELPFGRAQKAVTLVAEYAGTKALELIRSRQAARGTRQAGLLKLVGEAIKAGKITDELVSAYEKQIERNKAAEEKRKAKAAQAEPTK